MIPVWYTAMAKRHFTSTAKVCSSLDVSPQSLRWGTLSWAWNQGLEKFSGARVWLKVLALGRSQLWPGLPHKAEIGEENMSLSWEYLDTPSPHTHTHFSPVIPESLSPETIMETKSCCGHRRPSR